MKKAVLLMFAISLLFSFCGISKDEHDKALADLNSAKNEIGKLKSQIADLEKQLDDIKYGADRLLTNAKNFVDKKDYEKAKENLEALLKKHSASNEAREGEKLLANVVATIEKIKKEKEMAEKMRLTNATKKLESSYDKIEKITWYKDKYLNSVAYALKSEGPSRIELYMGKMKEGLPWLRFKIKYYGDDWVFLENYIIYIDGQKHILIPPVKPEKDNYGGSVWESNDLPVTEEIKQIIKKVISSKEAIIRYIGQNSGFDYVITKVEKDAIRNVIDGFEALGGKF